MKELSFSRLSLETAVEEFLQDRKTRNYSEATIRINRYHLEAFIAFIREQGVSDLQSIKLEHIVAFYDRLKAYRTKKDKAYAGNTTDKFLIDVRQFFRQLKKKGAILVDPAEALPPIKNPFAIPRNALTLEEAHAMLRQSKMTTKIGFRDLCILHVLMSTGIRPKSLISLNLYSLDFSDGFLRIDQAKGNQDYIVPLSHDALQACREYIDKVRPYFSRSNPGEKILFLTQYGTALNTTSLYNIVKKYARKAKIAKPISPYSFRRFVGVEMVRSGKCSILHVQQMLNHQNLKYVHLYTKMMPVDLKKAHSQLSRENREPRANLGFKGFKGEKPVYFKKSKGT